MIRPCKLSFFHKISKKEENEAVTNFVLLSGLRNMTERLKDTYMQKPIKIPQFLAGEKIQKCSL